MLPDARAWREPRTLETSGRDRREGEVGGRAAPDLRATRTECAGVEITPRRTRAVLWDLPSPAMNTTQCAPIAPRSRPAATTGECGTCPARPSLSVPPFQGRGASCRAHDDRAAPPRTGTASGRHRRRSAQRSRNWKVRALAHPTALARRPQRGPVETRSVDRRTRPEFRQANSCRPTTSLTRGFHLGD